MLIPERVVQTA